MERMATTRILICVALISLTLPVGALAQDKQSEGLAKLDLWLSQADRLSLDKPRPLHQDLARLPSANKLIVHALMEPAVMRRLGVIMVRSRKPRAQRIYAFYVLAHSIIPKALSFRQDLRKARRLTVDPLIRFMLDAALMRVTSRDEAKRLYYRLRSEHQWARAGAIFYRRTHRTDASLASLALKLWPESPSEKMKERLIRLFDSRYSSPAAFLVLLKGYPAASRPNQQLLIRILWCYDRTRRTENGAGRKVRTGIVEVARRLLLAEKDFSRDPTYAAWILERSATSLDARILAAALYRGRNHKRWARPLSRVIESMLAEKRWPHDVPEPRLR